MSRVAMARGLAPSGSGSVVDEAAGAVEFGAVGAAERGDLDVGARVRGVNEAAAADVDADVAEPVEEDEVAGLEAAAGDADATVEVGVARVGEADPEMLVDVAHEAGAVEAVARRAAAVDVAHPEEVLRVLRDLVAEGNVEAAVEDTPRAGQGRGVHV